MKTKNYLRLPYVSLPKRMIRFLLAFTTFICCITDVTAQNGYIYIHKKAAGETGSPNFTFNVTGGSTAVPSFTLNDDPAYINTIDLGSSQNGRLWAATTGGGLYYRDAGSSVWVNTGISNVTRVDGAVGSTAVYRVSSPNNAVYKTDGTTSTLIYNGAGGSTVSDVTSTWSGEPIMCYGGVIYQYSGSGNTIGSWSLFNTLVSQNTGFTRIDGDPSTGEVYGNKVLDIYSVVPGFAAITSLSKPATSWNAFSDIGVGADGSVYGIWNDNFYAYNFVYKWAGGTNWTTEEKESRYSVFITGGVGGQMWSNFNPNDAIDPLNYSNITTRIVDGATVHWLDDERVRTNPVNGNSELISVAPGTYTVEELATAGWDVTNIIAYDPTNNTSTSITAHTATVNVAAGEVVHIIFQNNNLSNTTTASNTCATQLVQTFGSGATNLGPALPDLITYHYYPLTYTNHFYDGYYALAKTSAGWPVTTLTNHTGDANGFFLVVNASYNPDEYYRQRVTGLLPGYTYDLSFWAADVTNNASLRPNITFGTTDPATGAILGSINTGNITATTWTKYTYKFTATSSTVDLFIRNNQVGGDGNDIALDDISFNLTMLNPTATLSGSCGAASGSITVTSPLGAMYEYSKDGVTWQTGPSFTSLAAGTYTIYARIVGNATCSSSASFTLGGSICGNVWNDTNGNAINSGENPITSGVWVNLVNNSTNAVIQSVPVDAAGNYILANVASSTAYKIILTNAVQTVGATLTTASMPTGYVATGTNLAGVASTANLTGIISVNSGTTGLANQNFGMEQPPTAGGGSNSAGNPGGTIQVPVPASTFTNTTPSTDASAVTGIVLTAFPAGVTSMFIGGVSYTTLAAITTAYPNGIPTDVNGNPIPAISVDPTATGAATITINFQAIDAAGKKSANTGAAVLTLTAPVTVSGNVWNDVNGNAVNAGETAITGGVWVNLVNPVTNDVIQSVQVNASGNYSLTNLATNTNYQIILSNADQTGNLNLTTSSMPAGYVPTGTNLSGTASTSNQTGIITINSGITGLTNQNFGIQQPPTALTGTMPAQTNPGGTTSVTIPAADFKGNDQNGGTIVNITISSFPTNATSITINGTTYTSSTFPVSGVSVPVDVNGNPAQAISIDPIDGTVTSVITYTATDNAGTTSAPATLSVPFFVMATPTCSGGNTVLDDYETTLTPVINIATGNTTVSTTTTGGGILGGERDITFTVSPSVTISPASNSIYAGYSAGTFGFSTGTIYTMQNITITYDGIDGVASGVNVSPGLGGINMMGTGAFGFNFTTDASTSTDHFTIKFRVYSDATHYSEGNTVYSSLVNSAINALSIPRASFATGSGAAGPADFSSVRAVQVILSSDYNAMDFATTSALTVPCANYLPTANPDVVNTNEDVPTTIPVLANDTFGGDGPSTGTITITNQPANGAATVNDGGTPNDPTDDQITYTPNANYNGNDTLIYQICDGNGDCDTAMVVLTVTPVNDLPTANPDVATTNEDVPATIPVLVNDTFGGDGPSTGTISITAQPINGIATVNDGGTPNDPTDDQIVYTPNPNFNGIDTLIYQICDASSLGARFAKGGSGLSGDCDTAMVIITVNPVNDIPTANPDVVTTNEDAPTTIPVLSNDTFGGDGPSTGTIAITTQPTNGTATVNDGGTPNDPTDDQIVYTPNPNFNGTDTLIYQICDSTSADILSLLDRVMSVGDCDTAMVIITVNPVNDLPTANPDGVTTNEDAPATIPVMSNDSFGGDGPSTGTISITTQPTNGTATVNDGGTPNDPTDDQITYTPNANYNGNDSLIYQICDTNGDCDTALVVLTITPVNDLPTATPDVVTTNEDTPTTILVLSNDTFGGDGPSTGTITITDQPNNGTAIVNDGGTPNDPTDDQITYTPNANYNGNDTLTYQICDSNGDCDTAMVVLTVTPVNDVPIANPDVASTNEDSPVTVPVLSNDTFGGDGPSSGTITITDQPNNATAAVNDGGTPNDPTDDKITYTPNANYNGNDTLTYQICDSNGDCDTALVVLTVAPVNDLPTANPDNALTTEDTPLTVPVLTNDTFGGDGPSTGTITITTQPIKGIATVNDGGTPNDPTDDKITYTPNANYNGNDTLNYQICDSNGDCDTSIVVITVATLMPVTLVDFSATLNDHAVSINWNIAQASGVKNYEVLFSKDGINFRSVGNILATSQTSYGFVHEFPEMGSNYYRLRIIDFDGTISYSTIKTVKYNQAGLISVYPNPVKTNINIIFSEDWMNKNVNLVLYNPVGQTVLNKAFKVDQFTESIGLGNIANGTYVLKLQRADNVLEMRKVLIMR